MRSANIFIFVLDYIVIEWVGWIYSERLCVSNPSYPASLIYSTWDKMGAHNYDI